MLNENKSDYAVVKLMDHVIDAVQAVVEEKIGMLNAAGKANTTLGSTMKKRVMDDEAFN